MAMDMRRYTGSPFLKPDDLREGPIEATIAGIEEGRYGKPNISFEDGTQFSVNPTNGRILAKAYGYDGEKWIGKKIRLELGQTKYDGKLQETIAVEPVSPAVKPKSPDDDMDDSIPFR